MKSRSRGEATPGKRNVYLYLAGGLGNQLFQLAAAIKNFPNHEIYLLDEVGNIRRNMDGDADIYSYELPDNVHKFELTKPGKLYRRSFAYLLRSKIVERKYENFLTKKLFACVANQLVLRYVREECRIIIGEGVGFSNLEATNSDDSYIVIGYFQTYVWAAGVIPNLKKISERHALLETTELAMMERPLAVHIRLGDYKDSPHFGIPSKKYYERAIATLWAENKYGKIWLFSDEPNLAMTYLPENVEYRVIDFPQDSAALALERLRLCDGYVIGNSTFGWWGAIATHNPEAKVVAPKKWFRLMKDPADLIPDNWQRFSAW